MKYDRNEIYFTSDSHFWHKNILKFCPNRKFSSIEEMNNGIISAWNKKVPKDGIVYHLGDFGFCSIHKMNDILDQLNGRIHIIKGNHDAEFPKRFESITYYSEITIGDRLIVASHYPFLVWNKSHRESYNLHGHCHNTLLYDPNALRMDVGVDSHPLLEPFNMNEIDAYMSKKTFVPLDHHDKDTK